jgi:deoxyribodipyrimidine photo-lyase
MISFETEYQKILDQVSKIDPLKYGRTRNYIDGAVTYLSPYISRGVISTKLVFNNLMERGYEPKRIEKFIQELAWRDYWQQVWIAKGDKINDDLKSVQTDVKNFKMPKALIDGRTGIDAIDKAINDFYKPATFITMCECILLQLPVTLEKVIGKFRHNGCIIIF